MNKHTRPQELSPRNDKGEKHGYWIRYYDECRQWDKGMFHNGSPIGLWSMKFRYHTKITFFII